MNIRTMFRLYGAAKGVDPARMAELRAALSVLEVCKPEEGDTRLEIEHEAGWLDADPLAEALAEALGPDGKAWLDVIDPRAWVLSRYVITPGQVQCTRLPIDDVMDSVRTS